MTKTLGVALLLAAFAVPAFAEAPQGDAARGKGLFMGKLCDSCHGSAGQGIRYGPRLAPGVFPWEGFEAQVRHPRAVMPRYPEKEVSNQELADIYAYLASIKRGPSAKDIPLLRE